MCWILACSNARAEVFPFLGEVTGNSVNVRAGQNTNYEVLTQLDKGDTIVVVGKKFEWFKIKLPDSAKSYISADYVQLLHSGIGEVSGNKVRIRAGILDTSSTLGKLNKGDKVRIRDKQSNWFVIEPVEGTYGWIAQSFVTYKSKRVPPPKSVVLPSLSIYPRAESNKEAETQTSAPSQVPEKTVTAQGALILRESFDAPDLQYSIAVNDKTYILEGGRHILNQFLDNQVKVEGVLDESTAASSTPVLSLRRIAFIL